MANEWNEQAERIIIALADFDPATFDAYEEAVCTFCGIEYGADTSDTAAHDDECLWIQARRLMQKARGAA